MTTLPGADELEARARLQDLGVSYAPTGDDVPGRKPGADPHEHAAPTDEEEAPAPVDEEEASVPAPRRSVPRLPDWWSPVRSDLPTEDQADQAAPEGPEGPESGDADEGEAPEPVKGDASSGRPGLRDRVRTWVEAVEERAGLRPAAEEDDGDDGDDEEGAGDTDEDDGDAEEDAGEGDGPKDTGPVRKTGSVKRRAPRPRHRPRFAVPGVPHTMKGPQERRSLVEVIRSTPDHVRWGIYNGSALAAGFWLGWPQWVTDGVAFLVVEHPTLTDAYSVTCYALAGAVLYMDGHVRTWRLLVAWTARVLTASLVVGVLMYGDPTPISQKF
ncbi:hypothetical protein F3K40_15335 [Streptomyces sp. LBUM 1478]|uniref:hypothetical protein n=1 Tax=Streptomyces scabiei TaxID=1930 RepID=UPI000765BE33|nr:hypothetical protein [Streptomyces scabiei]MBP5906830.1 hypothetical protein [Streptomyces sp. LBUM 1478]MBP5930444.1 hypothetical protein [Streptomyces sp. LBUM 1479]